VRAVLSRADAIVVPSRYGRGLVEAAGAAPSRVHVLPLGPTDETTTPRRSHAGFVVLALMRFVSTKGADVLVDAFARAFPADGDAVLVMGGEGPLRDATVERARAHGLGERARFPQWLEGDARRAAFADADVVVVPSVEGEMFCLTALDAQAAGVALIVSSQGALPERAVDGAALVVPRGDVDALADALRRVRDDAVFRETIAERGARHAASYGWPEVAGGHRALYEALGV
jgi:phenylacetate-CoA ligase